MTPGAGSHLRIDRGVVDEDVDGDHQGWRVVGHRVEPKSSEVTSSAAAISSDGRASSPCIVSTAAFSLLQADVADHDARAGLGQRRDMLTPQ